jgi:hypothetical protein
MSARDCGAGLLRQVGRPLSNERLSADVPHRKSATPPSPTLARIILRRDSPREDLKDGDIHRTECGPASEVAVGAAVVRALERG